MTSPAKTEEIKVRVDALSKSALVQIATSEQVDLSDIVRRALRELIMKQHAPQFINTQERHAR